VGIAVVACCSMRAINVARPVYRWVCMRVNWCDTDWFITTTESTIFVAVGANTNFEQFIVAICKYAIAWQGGFDYTFCRIN